MNASIKSVDLAEGVLVRAKFMNTPGSFNCPDKPEVKAWDSWKACHSAKELIAVLAIQADLFNAALNMEGNE